MLVPSFDLSSKQRLPDNVAFNILSHMPRHDCAAMVCQSWAKFCRGHALWGNRLRSKTLSERIIQWLPPSSPSASVCRCWWEASRSSRITFREGMTAVHEASAEPGKVWAPACAQLRAAVWAALSSRSAAPAGADRLLERVRECEIDGGPDGSGALPGMLKRCPLLRVADVKHPDAVQA
ncbi:unnamed protein product, partial [Prorocentrum cordatum]